MEGGQQAADLAAIFAAAKQEHPVEPPEPRDLARHHSAEGGADDGVAILDFLLRDDAAGQSVDPKFRS